MVAPGGGGDGTHLFLLNGAFRKDCKWRLGHSHEHGCQKWVTNKRGERELVNVVSGTYLVVVSYPLLAS